MKKILTHWMKTMFLLILFQPHQVLNAQFEFHQKLVGERESRAEFGTSTALNSQFMAIGASRENIGSGAAYIFHRNGDETWDFNQKIVPEDAREMAEFGGGIKLGTDFLVIASGRADIEEEIRAGALYVYDLNDANQWYLNTKLIASDFNSDAMLGMNPTSLDIDENIIVAGAPGENNWIGSVYVFQKINETWTEIQKITAPQAIEYSNFGIGVSISGNTLIVGASGENGGRGSVYVYEKNNSGTWEFVQKLTASTPQPNSYFGNSISIHQNQFVVGAYAEGNPGTDFASVYIFEKNGETWEETQKFVGESSSEDNFYGWMTKMTAHHLWVSAPHFFGEEPGKVHHYSKSAEGIWSETQIIQPMEAVEQDAFGWSFDYFEGNLAVGATRDDFDEEGENELMDAGSVFVFTNPNLEIIDLNPSENWLKIYPNPAQNQIHIKTNENLKSIEIYDNLGKLITRSSKNSIEISPLPKGIYFVKIITFSNRISTQKIIKQ